MQYVRWKAPLRAACLTLFLTSTAVASMFMALEGNTKVIVDKAPIRDDYPDGRILVVVNKGTTLAVHAMVGDGRGMWVNASCQVGGKTIAGVIDSEQTSIMADMSSKKVHSPKPK